jgi:hypothetical protein
MGRLTRWLHAIRSYWRRARVVGMVLPGVFLLTLALWRWGPILSAPVTLVAQAAVSEGPAVAVPPGKKPTPRPKSHPTPTPKPTSPSVPTLDQTPTDIPSPPGFPTMTAPTTLPTAAVSSTASSGARTGETAGSGNGDVPAMDASLLSSLGWGLGAMVVGMLGFSLVVFATRLEKGKRTGGRQRENGPKKEDTNRENKKVE